MTAARRPFYEDVQHGAPAPVPVAAVLKPYRERVTDKVRRMLGGEDTRPPGNWPFPTWKGQAWRATQDDGPEPPQRRGPKPKAHNAPVTNEGDGDGGA